MISLENVLHRVRRIEDGFIVAIYGLMMVLPVSEVVLRKFFHTGVPGQQVYVQHLTLWCGFWGAALAAREGGHLHLSTGELFETRKAKDLAKLIAHSVAAAVNGILVYAGVLLVKADSARPDVFPSGIPEWISELAVPIAFAFVTFRIILRAHPHWWGRGVALAVTVLALAGGAVAPNSAAVVYPCIALIVIALLLGAPVYVAMSGVAMALFFADGTPVASVPAAAFQLVESPALPAIPLLTIAGYVLAEGGSSTRILRMLRAWLGWFPGGSAVVVAGVLAAFTTLTGGSGVTILALGGVVLPILLKERYPDGFSHGLVTAAGSLGLLFWPSVPVLLYSVVAKDASGAAIPVTDLYIGGFLPGVLLVLLVSAYGVWVGRRAKVERTQFEPGEAWKALWGAKWDLGLPLVIGSAFATGFATFVEAAAIAVAYAVLVECVIYRNIPPLKKLPDVIVRGGTLVGAVIILLAMATGLTGYFVDAEIPSKLIAWASVHLESKWVFLLALNCVLLVLGSVLEIYGAIIILGPLLAPLASHYDIAPVHLGVVILANLEMGFLLPPLGINLFLSATRFNRPLSSLYRQAAPFLIIQAIGVLITTYFEPMSTGVLKLFHR
jgi:C4-dicarboxylate transporter, DctM subunit